jgi:hypothetical protein
MESLDSRRPGGRSKRQNVPERYGEMIELWRRHGIVTQVGYIIGFPYDTLESVARRRGARDVGRPDLVHFFMLTPLPGTKDHLDLVGRGVAPGEDLNLYDTCHAVALHPRMTAAEWEQAFRDAWLRYYRVDNVRAILARAHQRAAAFVEGAHLVPAGGAGAAGPSARLRLLAQARSRESLPGAPPLDASLPGGRAREGAAAPARGGCSAARCTRSGGRPGRLARSSL